MKKFSGKLGEWEEFCDSFESAIHLNNGLSNVDKFSYLGSLLLEPARSDIGGFALTSANYEPAIELLKKRYGKKIAIQRSLVNKLFNAHPIFNECDTPRLRSLYDFAEAKYRALQALGVEEKNYSEVAIPTLLEKIPDSIRLTITQGKKYLEWTLGDMLEALLVEVELREDHCLMQHRVGSREGRKGPCTSSALFTTKGDDKRCTFCLGSTHRRIARRLRTLLNIRNCYLNLVDVSIVLTRVTMSEIVRLSLNVRIVRALTTKLQQPSGGDSNQPSTVNAPSSLLVGTESRIARLNHFWNRWQREYLANLREFYRCKVQNRDRTVEVGDIVVVYEEEKKRGGLEDRSSRKPGERKRQYCQRR